MSVRLKLEPSCRTYLAIAAGAIHHVDIEKHFAATAWAIADPSLSLRPAGTFVRHVRPVRHDARFLRQNSEIELQKLFVSEIGAK